MKDTNKIKDIEYKDDLVKKFEIGKSLLENSEKGIKYLKCSIEKGNTEAVIYYSQLLIKGEIVPKNYKRCKKYLETKLDENNPTVYYLYGKVLQKERKYKEAEKYLKLSITGGCGEAMYEYGKMLFNKNGLFQKKKEALELFELAKKNGCNKSDRFISKMNERNNERRQNNRSQMLKSTIATIFIGILVAFSIFLFNEFFCENESNIQYLKIRAEKGDLNSMYEYGTFLLRGNTIHSNRKEALFYLKKAADNGHIKSMKTYSDVMRSSENLEQIKEGIKYIKIAADNGDVDSMYRLGLVLNDGRDGVQQNLDESRKYLKMAADKGNTKAMIFYSKSIKGTLNDDDSIKYLKMAADNDDINGMYLYALMFLDDKKADEVKINEAIQYLIKSANSGQRDAMYKYATMMINGLSVPQNKEEGMALLKKAAEKGHLNAINDYRSLMFKNKENL